MRLNEIANHCTNSDKQIVELKHAGAMVHELFGTLMKMDQLLLQWIDWICINVVKDTQVHKLDWISLGQEMYSCIKKLRNKALNDKFWMYHWSIFNVLLPNKPVKGKNLCEFKFPWLDKQYHFATPISATQAQVAINMSSMIMDIAYNTHVSAIYSWYNVMQIHNITSMLLIVLLKMRDLIAHKMQILKEN